MWDDLHGTATFIDELVDDVCKKEKEEMKKNPINVCETDRVSVNYGGHTYYVDTFEQECRPLNIAPTCRIEFTPAPSRRIMGGAHMDPRCKTCPPRDQFEIDKVTFNGPKTIVEWKDGTKTIVNCNDECYDPEKGLAMAIVKKALGNKGNYYNAFRKAMEGARYYNQPVTHEIDIADMILARLLCNLNKDVECKEEEE